MTISALIVEDEILIAEDLARQINARDGWNAEILTNPEQALEHIRKARPSVCFLDIEMPGKNGIELGHEIAAQFPDILIVYVTAYSHYAASAFRVRAYDYLVKPVARAQLTQTCDGAEVALKAKAQGQKPAAGHRIAVRSAGRVDFVPVSEISYCQAVGNYVALVSGKKEYLHRIKISDLAVELSHHGFVRTHRSYLINVSLVQSAKRRGDGITEIIAPNGEAVPVSASYQEEVATALAGQ